MNSICPSCGCSVAFHGDDGCHGRQVLMPGEVEACICRQTWMEASGEKARLHALELAQRHGVTVDEM